MNFRPRFRADPVGFQIAPMLDVVFQLLAFFLITSIYSVWEKEIDISLPTAQTGQSPQRLPGEIIINIIKDGGVTVNGRTLDDPSLQSLLKRLVSLFPGQPVLIRADKATPYEHVIHILDLCRKADIWNISFATGIPET
jgi:biopolymer transport protein ExbD